MTMSERMTANKKVKQGDLTIKLRREFNTPRPDEDTAFNTFNKHLRNPGAVALAIADEAFFIMTKDETAESLSPSGQAIRNVLDITHNGARIGLEPSESSWARVFDDPSHKNAANEWEKGDRKNPEDARWRSLCTLGVVVTANLDQQKDRATIIAMTDALAKKPVHPGRDQKQTAA